MSVLSIYTCHLAKIKAKLIVERNRHIPRESLQTPEVLLAHHWGERASESPLVKSVPLTPTVLDQPTAHNLAWTTLDVSIKLHVNVAELRITVLLKNPNDGLV